MSAELTPGEVRYWAEAEHREVVAQAAERHLERLAAEERRFREELAHFENIRQLRLSVLEAEGKDG